MNKTPDKTSHHITTEFITIHFVILSSPTLKLKQYIYSINCCRSAPASPSHLGISDVMTPDSLSREGSPILDHGGQSAPGSPGSSSVARAGSGGMIGHQQMTALVGVTKARLLLPQHHQQEHYVEQQVVIERPPSNGQQEYREGKQPS